MTATSRSLGSNPILLEPRALVTGLASFEALLLLYIFFGIYKSDPRFAWFPVDATALFFVLCVVAGSFIIVFNPIHRKGLPLVFAMVCLVTWFLVSLTWSPSKIYGPGKVLLMASADLWAVVAGALIIAPNPQRVRRLFTLMLVFSLCIGVEALINYQAGRSQISVGSGNYLTLGRIAGLGALVALAGWLYSRRVTGWLCLITAAGLGFILVVGGGRGPFLATALALLIPVGLGIRLTPRKIRYSRALILVVAPVVVLAAALSLYVTISGRTLGTLDRLERIVAGSELQGSEAKRAENYVTALKLWSEAPVLGHGAGSWPVLVDHADRRGYPHNVFAELAVEGGMVALFLFLALLVVAFRPLSLERLQHDPQALCAMMLFAATLLNAMVSGDLTDNQEMFMMIGLLALLAVARPAVSATAATRLAGVADGAPPLRGRGLAPGAYRTALGGR